MIRVELKIGIRTSAEASLPFGQRPVLTQTLEHILDVDNGIVDKASYCDSYAAEAHGIYGIAHEMQYQNRYYNRHRNRHHRDNCRAQIHQKKEEYNNDKQSSFEKCLLKIGY